MRFRNQLNGLALATLGAGLVLSGPATAQTELKFASFVSPKYVLHKPIFEKMANDVAAATNGKLKIRIYPSGELGKGPVQQYSRAVKGIADITMGVTGYTSSLFPRTLLIEMPGIAKDGMMPRTKCGTCCQNISRPNTRGRTFWPLTRRRRRSC